MEKIIAQVDVVGHTPIGKEISQALCDILPDVAKLQMVSFSGNRDIFLMHYDRAGKPIAKTCHENIDWAIYQAGLEFGLKKEDWKFFK